MESIANNVPLYTQVRLVAATGQDEGAAIDPDANISPFYSSFEFPAFYISSG